MDYKSIIKSRKIRLTILGILSFVPDVPMIKMQYRIKTGRNLNLNNPRRFTEKLQWYKLYYKDPLMIKCVDKYDVRDYVKSKGLDDILISCYGVYPTPDEIPWKNLPDSFVVKDTLGGGGNAVILVKNKHEVNIEELKEICRGWVIRDNNKSAGREWPYCNGKKHRIIIEDYVETVDPKGNLIDYKFFCFNGKVAFLYVMGDREVGQSVKVSIFDRAFNKIPVTRVGDEEFHDAKKPENFEKMIHIAEILSEDFPHVRVDLFNVNGIILFGELTFYNASGYMKYNPDRFDIIAGEMWELDPKLLSMKGYR